MKAVRDQVQESPGDLLREYVDFARSGIKRPLNRNLEALILGASTMIGWEISFGRVEDGRGSLGPFALRLVSP
jgi:hypothetical protein